MTYDFDSFSPRLGRNVEKWDGMTKYGVDPHDTTPMFVADMDFRSPPAIADAAREMVEHGYFGYTSNTTDLQNAVCDWMAQRHNWTVDPNHVMTTHGIVNAVALAIDAFSQRGDGVAFFTPVYHAFARVVESAQRKVVELPLQTNNNSFVLDFAHYDDLIAPDTKILIICSPHNPAGQIWTTAELRAMAEFAQRHDLIILSDEIHHDLIMPGETFVTFQNAAPAAVDRLVVLTSPSKTFNIAGNHTGNAIIPDDALRKTFQQTMVGHGIGPNMFGLSMAAAAYCHGADWLDALLPYLAANRDVMADAIDQIPGAKMMTPMQSTYLAWVNFADTGLSAQQVIKRVQDDAKIVANYGPTFGTGGADHLRFNFAMPRAMLESAMQRLIDAFDDLQ